MFVRAANPIWFMVDLIGQPLNDEYYAFFLTNTLPYLPQPVYRDPQGVTAWPDPLEFFPNGTLPDNLYFDPNLVYRIEIRHGNSQTDALIYEINNFIPGEGTSPGNNSLAILGNENQISNGQFAEINFDSPLTITMAGTYPIAPGWELVLTGSGSTTLTQIILSGSQNQINNPPFALRVNNNGWTESFLRQRFNHNGAIWANGAITMSITARAQTLAETISLLYAPNPPGVSQLVATGILNTADYQVIQGAIDLPASVNTSLSTIAYVDMIVQLPPTGIVDITNIQVIGQSVPLPTNFDPLQDIPSYQQESEERMIDHLFHYYQPQLNYKPIPSYLIGWDFPLNPAQLGSTNAASAIGANKSKYVWDQTILFQSVDSGVGVTRGTAGELLLTAVATTQMAVIQYLDAPTARKILNSRLAVNVSAKTSVVAGVLGTVSLWYTTDVSLPDIGSNNSIVLTLDANGKPATQNGTWTEVKRTNGQDAKFTVEPNSTTNFNDYSLNGWDLKGAAAANTATFFAIVVGFASVATPQTIGLNSISLNAGDIATRPAPQAISEVLRECQNFYEQSWNNGGTTSPVGTDTFIGSTFYLGVIWNNPNNTSVVLYPGAFTLTFKTTKRVAPTLVFYSKDGTIDTIRTGIAVGTSYTAPTSGANPRNTAIALWQAPAISLSNAVVLVQSGTDIMTITSGGAEAAASAEFIYHYTADSRLGVI